MYARFHSGVLTSCSVQLSSRGFTWIRLKVVGCIRVRLGSLTRAKGASGSDVFAWVPSCAPWGRRVYTVSFGVCLEFVGFIGVPLGSAHWSPGSLESTRIHSSANVGRRVNWRSRVFTRAHLGVVWFIRVGVGSLRRA